MKLFLVLALVLNLSITSALSASSDWKVVRVVKCQNLSFETPYKGDVTITKKGLIYGFAPFVVTPKEDVNFLFSVTLNEDPLLIKKTMTGTFEGAPLIRKTYKLKGHFKIMPSTGDYFESYDINKDFYCDEQDILH